ncbi:MAG: hypothetical protein RSB24_02625 [Akkermansia sp.]
MNEATDSLPKIPKNTLLQRLGMTGFFLFEHLLTIFSIETICRIGRILGWASCVLMPHRRRIVARNLRIVIDPTLQGKKLDTLVMENCKRMGMNMLAAAKTSTMNNAQILEHVDIIGHDKFEAPLLAGQSTICAINHSGNWEILARIRAFFPKIANYGSMYRQMDNPLMEEYLYTKRTSQGTEMFSKEGGIQAPLLFLKKKATLGVLCDQFVQEGVFVPYFGKVTGTTYLPALLHKRTKASIIAVCVRSTGIGHWESDMKDTVSLESGDQSFAGMTITINQSIEKRVSISPLDGFWMHHRWKVPSHFAPQDEKTNRLLATMPLKPFRILLATPLAFDEALLVVPMVRALRACRSDMQINIICPEEQAGFWQTIPEVSHTIIHKEEHQLRKALFAPSIYNDGPFDLGIMLDKQKSTIRALNPFSPLFFTGFASHPMAKKGIFKGILPNFKAGALYHRIDDYLRILQFHDIPYKNPAFFPSAQTIKTNTPSSFLLAPYSTLGSANEWDESHWSTLLPSLPGSSKIIALPADQKRANDLATRLGLDCIIQTPENMLTSLYQASIVIAVDGLIPALASHVGTPCLVLFGSRLPERNRPLGTMHRCLHHHTPCAGCGHSTCQYSDKCINHIQPEQILRAIDDIFDI